MPFARWFTSGSAGFFFGLDAEWAFLVVFFAISRNYTRNGVHKRRKSRSKLDQYRWEGVEGGGIEGNVERWGCFTGFARRR